MFGKKSTVSKSQSELSKEECQDVVTNSHLGSNITQNQEPTT
jgi:hypothetical protein